MLDNTKNFAKVIVSTGYDATATSIVLHSGHGAKLPAPPFNITWWNVTDYVDPSDDPDVEIDRVINIVGDIITLEDNGFGNRLAQEGTTATVKNIPGKIYRMLAGLTAKTMNNDVATSFVLGFNNTIDWTYDAPTDSWYIDFIHNLNSLSPVVSIKEASDADIVEVQIHAVDVNTTRISVPATPDLRFAGTVSIIKT